MADPSIHRPAVAPSADETRTYRINTGSAAFVPFAAHSVEDAIEYVRRNQNPHYAAARWLQVLKDGAFVWVT